MQNRRSLQNRVRTMKHNCLRPAQVLNAKRTAFHDTTFSVGNLVARRGRVK